MLDHKTITRHYYTLRLISDFQDYLGQKLRITDIGLDFHNKFIYYLKEVCTSYGNTTIDKQLTTIKQYIREAEQKGYKINPEIKSRNFTIKKEETIDTYLNEEEIDLIFNYDLAGNEELNDVRDLFITGLWTGLRISDLKRINSFDISNNRIKIVETEKTGSFVEIPIHPHLKQIIEKRNGVLPKVTQHKFNEDVKVLCDLVGITEVILGGVKES